MPVLWNSCSQSYFFPFLKDLRVNLIYKKTKRKALAQYTLGRTPSLCGAFLCEYSRRYFSALTMTAPMEAIDMVMERICEEFILSVIFLAGMMMVAPGSILL